MIDEYQLECDRLIEEQKRNQEEVILENKNSN